MYSAQTLGWGWDSPASFTLVNFDEGGSCRAALEGFNYSGFIGHQTIAIASVLGSPPPEEAQGDARVSKAYCHSAEHIGIARGYSALAGALTVVLTAVIALMLLPAQPALAWVSGALLAVSGFHISESHSGTVDASSVFFIYLFIAFLMRAVLKRSALQWVLSPVFLTAAVWTKYWVFAVFAYVACLPSWLWEAAQQGFSRARMIIALVVSCILLALLSNLAFRDLGAVPQLVACALWCLVIPWRKISKPMALFFGLFPLLCFAVFQFELIANYTASTQDGRFGTSYGAIGWGKIPRNLFNIPMVLLVGLGLPAFLLFVFGLRAIFKGVEQPRLWLCLMPVMIFAVFMAFISPITYYRHYLPLLPAACIVAAYGLVAGGWYRNGSARRFGVVAIVILWPIALAVDLVSDYHQDPRIELREWSKAHRGAKVFYSFYVNPPAGSSRLFRPEYAQGEAVTLRQADYLILSENWYDTAFANELNGPFVHNVQRLIKTRPQYTDFYRQALANEHPHLNLEKSIEIRNVMPELRLHSWMYGTFQLFVGDLKIFRIVAPANK